MSQHPLIRYFTYHHLPAELQEVSKQFYQLAVSISKDEEPNGQLDVALQKLLEAKDAAVRAQFI